MRRSLHRQRHTDRGMNSFFCETSTNVDELSYSFSEIPGQNEKGLQDAENSLDDAKKFWLMLEAEGKVDLMFERVNNILLSLKQKIKDGSATHQDYLKAMVLVNEADLSTTAASSSSSDDEDDLQKHTPHLHAIQEDPYPVDSSVLTPDKKETSISSSESSGEDKCSSKVLPVRRTFQSHCLCSVSCFSERTPFPFIGENILKIPVLCNFQRLHAKATHLSKPLDVYYQAPCGRSLRNFEEVQKYLFETECNFLFINYFSFNTYVQIDRTPPNVKALAWDSDISRGLEPVPVSFSNEIDCSKLPYFVYTKAPWPRGYHMENFSTMFKDSCSCTDGCSDILKCACLQLTARTYGHVSPRSCKKEPPGYCYKRLNKSVPTGIFECSMSCKCDPLLCQNRVVQDGLQVRLQVFQTEKKGWGVRCLDDMDSGTFVCIFAGKILCRNVNVDVGLEDPHVNVALEENAEGVPASLPVLPRKRQIEASSSDSEIELVQNVPEDSVGGLEKLVLPPQPADDEKQIAWVQKYGYNPRNLRHPVVKRPKTKTAILQSRRKQLFKKRATPSKHLSSEEDSPVKHSPKAKLSKMTAKDKSSKSEEQVTEEVTEEEEDRLSESLVVTRTCRSKEYKLPPLGTEHGKRDRIATSDTESVIKYSRSEIHAQESLMDGSKGLKQDALICKEHLASPQDPLSLNCSLDSSVNEQNTYLFDATKEGNVGRFLNHSCSPNLFVQNVFVDTHDINLPWVAFFTNRYVKAGTELTWDYNYEVGTMPENEIPCLCGVPKCRKRIV